MIVFELYEHGCVSGQLGNLFKVKVSYIHDAEHYGGPASIVEFLACTLSVSRFYLNESVCIYWSFIYLFVPNFNLKRDESWHREVVALLKVYNVFLKVTFPPGYILWKYGFKQWADNGEIKKFPNNLCGPHKPFKTNQLTSYESGDSPSRHLSHWGQASSRKQPECGTHDL